MIICQIIYQKANQNPVRDDISVIKTDKNEIRAVKFYPRNVFAIGEMETIGAMNG